ncbi:spore gernimation protein GerPD [Paenibacillus selenitireducens]|uniref:Spore gernimation protein GerPD n=1 Tax=Paenibacillus selenitireducens TaxID=1324314 RepID=A0A1T2XDB1_9BACL|nr:spore gernimation protein GerPD [Paenibacillus selenitireducens]
MTVINKEIKVTSIRVTSVSTSSVLMVGDTEVIKCSSISDTPPESVIVTPAAPVPARS